MPYKNRHPLYFVWTSMIQRCHTKTNKAFKWYGARGIQVCERWREDFQAFLLDMGDRPAGHSIERINNEGNYEPSNCKWATDKEQQRNRRTTKLTAEDASAIALAVAQPTANKTQIADRFGVSRALVRRIANKEVWQ